MSVEVKAAVRERDGHRCRRCGMSDEEHRQEFDTTLHVHRIIPGSNYDLEWCVTLCRSCHGKMPRTIDQAFWADEEEVGVQFFHFNLFDPRHRRIWKELKERAAHLGVEVGALVEQAMIEFTERPVCHYTI